MDASMQYKHVHVYIILIIYMDDTTAKSNLTKKMYFESCLYIFCEA